MEKETENQEQKQKRQLRDDGNYDLQSQDMETTSEVMTMRSTGGCAVHLKGGLLLSIESEETLPTAARWMDLDF